MQLRLWERWWWQICEALWRESQWQVDTCGDGAGRGSPGSGGKGWGRGGSWNRLLPVAGNWGSVGSERVGRQCRRAESDTIRGAWAPQSDGCCRGGGGGANICRKRRLDRVERGRRGPLFLLRRSGRGGVRGAWWEWRRVWCGWSRKSVGWDLQWTPQWSPTLSWREREEWVNNESDNEKWRLRCYDVSDLGEVFGLWGIRWVVVVEFFWTSVTSPWKASRKTLWKIWFPAFTSQSSGFFLSYVV